MSELLALSADIPIVPRMSFASAIGTTENNGWGLCWYPEQELRATAVRDPSSRGSGGLTEVLADWELINTPLLMAHVRGATTRAIYRDTQPFIYNFRGSSWSMAHSGELMCDLEETFRIDESFPLQPVGVSDTERVFCWIMSKIDEKDCDTIEEFGFDNLAELLAEANIHGTLTVQISDGRSLFNYRCNSGGRPLYFNRTTTIADDRNSRVEDPLDPNRLVQKFGDNEMGIDVLSDTDSEYCISLCSTVALNEYFEEVSAGCYVIFDRGSTIKTDSPEHAEPVFLSRQAVQGPPSRDLRVTHITRYTYEKPVDKSGHRLRLHPVSDKFQTVLNYDLHISVDGLKYGYEDVFGNYVLGADIDATYSELTISMSADVNVRTPIDTPELMPAKQVLPVFWLPWQAKMMQSYLLPPELPESQLRTLTDYAKSFAARNRGELLPTLEDITTTIYNDFVYKPGFTDIETTPFEVLQTRKGVCQDFANLMICLARMLNIPARYRVGYIYTGSDYQNTQQSDASHAWVEAYLPHFGWRGFDPTNGSKASGDHIRVATGRNYRDATPTSGVIYGGGKETLEIDVQVVDRSDL